VLAGYKYSVAMKKSVTAIISLLLLLSVLSGQENLPYQIPPREILELVDVPRAPSVWMNEEKSVMVLMYRDAFQSIEELSRTELRLGGLRIDPVTNIGSRTTYVNDIKIQSIVKEGETARPVSGLPEKPMLSNFTWSPDQKKMAFTHTTSTGVEIWLLDIAGAEARKLTGTVANANTGSVISWFGGNDALLVKKVPGDRKPLVDTEKSVPTGPTISVADGRKAQNWTYQDLLKNKDDEFNFEQLVRSEIVRVTLDGKEEPWLGTAMYDDISFSPDGNYVMVTTLEKPFSYMVPYYRFPSKTSIYTSDATPVETVEEVPLIEDLPKGFMAVRKGRRNLQWRSDQASTLVFVEALDDGDPENEAEYRDEVLQLMEPFRGEPVSLLKTGNRFRGILWGNDRIAVAMDFWWNTRNTRSYLFNPSDPKEEPVLLFDLLYKISLYRVNKKRLYQSGYTDRLESIRDFDAGKDQLLVSIESPNEYPNYYFRDLKRKQLQQITAFENPFRSIQDVHKKVITYKRDDGLELSGTLYLPAGYDMETKPKAPMILWAYPVEYKDKASAGQNTSNPNQFTYPYYGSPVLWVTRGYVILDDAAFPIVGEGDEEPNDSFRKQLVANARAAIDAVDSLGYIDRNRVAAGGHSYGAFMVANLLSHSDLFAAGIARSGAYNRTLTPFGFQSEERYYWEAPEVYYNMSPFMHADKMKTPLLLIHGETDNNSGTFPMQSTRYFNALKGLGATVRLVMLPKESHGYRAKESILHMLWEQDQWLEKYVKNRQE
jgi:dipeptidyl aminopeptidase/acylaminoacyl peptidase